MHLRFGGKKETASGNFEPVISVTTKRQMESKSGENNGMEFLKNWPPFLPFFCSKPPGRAQDWVYPELTNIKAGR
jgi:hypothetical protein